MIKNINIIVKKIYLMYRIIKTKKFIGNVKNEEVKRKMVILNTLSLSIITFLILLLILSIYSSFKNTSVYINLSSGIIFLSILLSIISFLLSQKGRILLSSFIILTLIYGCIFYGSIKWGVDLPTVLIALFIVVLMSGILINSKAGLVCAIIFSIHLSCFNYMTNNHLIKIDYNWKKDFFNTLDVIEYSSLLIFASVFSWLSNSQLEKSLKRSRNAEIKIQTEKDNLEIKVKERTEEIKNMQIDKINSMYRMVEFGRISSALFHDIINPLTNITLSLSTLKVNDAKNSIELLIPSIKKIENLIQQSKKHIKIDKTYSIFNVKKEILSVTDILKSKLNKNMVKIIIKTHPNIELYGSQTLFSHIIMNLLSNGIDSHDDKFKQDIIAKNKFIILKIKINLNYLNIKVTDNGCGINKNIISNIFEPFYTTKKEQGCGIGLSSTKHILEKYFDGKICVKSQIKKGTSFIINIPLERVKFKNYLIYYPHPHKIAAQ
jgi:signal transduction histidine kinase